MSVGFNLILLALQKKAKVYELLRQLYTVLTRSSVVVILPVVIFGGRHLTGVQMNS